MARFDLNLLPALNALLSERHVSRAARAINVSQPTMSGMLQRLRHQFRDDLLVRVGHTLELTPFAETLSERVREAVLEVGRLAEAVPSFAPGTSTRLFRLMASDYCVATFLPRVLHKLAAEGPGLRLEIPPMDQPVTRLAAGEIDLCLTADDWRLLHTDAPKDLLRGDILFSDTFVGLVDADHPIGDRPGLDEYFIYPHVHVGLGAGVDTIEHRSVLSAMPHYRPNFTVPDFMAIPHVVRGSRIIGVVQRRLADLARAGMALRMIEPPLPIEPVNETLIWHTRNSADVAHTWLRSLIQREAGSLLQQPATDPQSGR